jgi:hypothetical protein
MPSLSNPREAGSCRRGLSSIVEGRREFKPTLKTRSVSGGSPSAGGGPVNSLASLLRFWGTVLPCTSQPRTHVAGRRDTRPRPCQWPRTTFVVDGRKIAEKKWRTRHCASSFLSLLLWSISLAHSNSIATVLARWILPIVSVKLAPPV